MCRFIEPVMNGADKSDPYLDRRTCSRENWECLSYGFILIITTVIDSGFLSLIKI